MRIIDLNKDGGIGANCLFIQVGPFCFLMDSGLHPKKMGLGALPDFQQIKDVRLDFIILTHCHLDHLGALPLIVSQQPQVKVLVTPPTLTLAPRMLRNSFNVMKRQREEYGIKEYPLYNHVDISVCQQNMLPMLFGKPWRFLLDNQEISITFHPSGHLPGAAACHIIYQHRNILFTGDVLFKPQRILPGARFPQQHFDTLVIETTRGARMRKPGQTRQSEIKRLFEAINQRIDQGGSCLIPTFALGRMQELLALMSNARRNGNLIDCPIYCSGLGRDLINYFDKISRKTQWVNFRRQIIKPLHLQRPNWEQIKPGRDPTEKGIYLLSSGMLVENTPSFQMAASLIHHAHNAVFFIGYCDPDTPGGKLLQTDHVRPFVFESLDYVATVQAHIDQFDLSSHADREELLTFALTANPRSIVLTHGDDEARSWFREHFANQLPDTRVTDPVPLNAYSV